MATMTENIVSAIEAELGRLGWLRTTDSPCYYCVTADDDLPRGWVQVYDDYAETFGPADEILAWLKSQGGNAEYGVQGFYDRPTTVRDWPDELVSTEQLEEGGCNDEPNTLVTVETNAGIRYAAGPHGVGCDTLNDWLVNGAELAKTREEAIAEGCEADAEEDE